MLNEAGVEVYQVNMYLAAAICLYTRQCSEFVRSSLHCPACICGVVRKHCSLLAAAARCTVTSLLNVPPHFKCQVEFNWPLLVSLLEL